MRLQKLQQFMRKDLARRDPKFYTIIKGQHLYIENYFLGTPPQVLPLCCSFSFGSFAAPPPLQFLFGPSRISLDQVRSSEDESKFTQEHVKQKHKTTIWKWKFAMTSSVKDHWHWHWSINGHCCIIDVKVIVCPYPKFETEENEK